MNMDINNDGDVSISGFAAVECGLKINEDGSFAVFFDRLEPMVVLAMFHPQLADLVMTQVWEEAESKGISLR